MSQKKPSLTIRNATAEDVTHLARIFEAIEAQAISCAHMRTRLEAAKVLETPILAQIKGQVVGLACLRLVPTLSSDTPHAELTELYIPSDCQDQQVEELLLAQAESQALQCGARYITLLTGIKNTAAQGLYHRLGYHDFALAMRKHLRKR